MDCGWLAYFYSCALFLLIRDIFLTLQSGQKVPKMVPSPLVLFLCHCCLCVFVFYGCCCLGKITMVSPPSQKTVLEQNVFSSEFGFFWKEGLDKDSFKVSDPGAWLEGQRANSDCRANSGRASTANCFNCQVSWKDCIHFKNARWWSAYCRTEDAFAFVVTVGLQRTVCLFCLFPCFCAPQEWCLLLTLEYQINLWYLQAAFLNFPQLCYFFL